MTPDVAVQQARGPHLGQDGLLDADHVGQRAVRGDVLDVAEQHRHRGHRHGQHDQRVAVGGPRQRLGEIGGGLEPVHAGGLRALDGPVVAESVASGRHRCAQYRPADQPQPEHAHGCLRHAFQVGTRTRTARVRPGAAAAADYLVTGLISDYRKRPWKHREPGRGGATGFGRHPDGFGVAVVREDGKWRCAPMSPKVLTSLSAAETELRELRSAGAVFGLLDIDDEFFLIVRPPRRAPGCCCRMRPRRWTTTSPPRRWKPSTPTSPRRISEESDPFEEGDLGVLSDIGLPDAVLG